MSDEGTRSLDELRRRLGEREAELNDLRAALPRHSMRPHQMAEVEDAEDDVAALRAEIATAEQEG
jgi:hypothetical protein